MLDQTDDSLILDDAVTAEIKCCSLKKSDKFGTAERCSTMDRCFADGPSSMIAFHCALPLNHSTSTAFLPSTTDEMDPNGILPIVPATISQDHPASDSEDEAPPNALDDMVSRARSKQP